MSNRTSSITASLKLAGLSGFKSELGQAGVAARSLGRDLQAIKPINFDGGANQARKSWQLTEEHQRAHHRVLERQAKANQGRMSAMGGAAGGKRKGGLNPGGNAGQAYNFVQDLAQGGIPAVANNVPWLIGVMLEHPKLIALAAAAATAAAAGAAVKTGYDLYQDTGERFDNKAAKRYAQNRMAADSRAAARKAGQARDAAGVRGDVASSNQAGYGGYIDQQSGQVSAETARRNELLDATAMDERKRENEKLTNKRAEAKELMRIASIEQEAAAARYKAIKSELAAQSTAARTPEEINRAIELEKELAGLKNRMAEADKRASQARGGMDDIAHQEKLMALRREDEDKQKRAADYLENKQREMTRYEHRVSAIERENQKKYEEEQTAKDKKATTDDLSERELTSRMSPRALAKYQEKKRIKDDTERFTKQGFSPEEAAKMAGRENQLAKDNDPSRKKRIRGAGYGGSRGEDANGLGSATYGGLDDLAAMQPAASRERKTIKGAGAKEKQSGSNDGPDNLYQVMVKGFNDVVKAVRDTGPNATDRAKPSSSN